jgi:hypothetical protein
MEWFNLRRDGLVLVLLALITVMLISGLAGAYHVFGYALVALLGTLAGLGFVRRGDPLTWVPPLIVTTVLVSSFAGMFAYESSVVGDANDTVLGFQPGTAFLVYGVWIPAFFTLGVSFAVVFDRLSGSDGHPSDRTGATR